MSKQDELKVMFRTRDSIVTARLQIEGNRAFAVLYEYGRKGSDEIFKEERIELKMQFLEKMDPSLGADYLYKQEVQLPDPGKN